LIAKTSFAPVSLLWSILLLLGPFAALIFGKEPFEKDLKVQKRIIIQVKEDLYLLSKRIERTKERTGLPLKERQAFQMVTGQKISELDQHMEKVVREKWIKNPDLYKELHSALLPAFKALKEKNRARNMELVPLKTKDLEMLRNRLKKDYEKKDFAACLQHYKKKREELGDFVFESADHLDKGMALLVKEIVTICRRAKSEMDFQCVPVRPAANGTPKKTKAYHVRVVPTLGTPYEAVIKDPELVAQIEKNQVLDLNSLDPESSLTLYYMRGMNGQMSIRVTDVTSVEVLHSLGEKDMENVRDVIGRRINTLHQEEKKRQAVQKKETHPPKEIWANRKKDLAKKKKPEESKENRFSLLTRFPPSDGWGLEKKKKLEWRKVVIKVFPNPEEQVFLDRFEEWSKQYKAWKSLQDKSKASPKNKKEIS
jgi:hypothetical protein